MKEQNKKANELLKSVIEHWQILQNTSVEDIMDNNVRITELIQKCLLIGIA